MVGIEAAEASSRLDTAIQRFGTHIGMSDQLVQTLAPMIERQVPEEEPEGWRELKRELFGPESGFSMSQMSPEILDYFIPYSLSQNRARLLCEQAVVYLVAQYEGCVREQLRVAFEFRPEAMRSGRQVTYQEVLAYDSGPALVAALADREAKRRVESGPEDLADFLLKQFSIDWRATSQWGDLCELLEHRHVIVHSGSMTDANYVRKVGKGTVGHLLRTSPKYVKGAAEVLGTLLDLVDEGLRTSLSLPKTRSIDDEVTALSGDDVVKLSVGRGHMIRHRIPGLPRKREADQPEGSDD